MTGRRARNGSSLKLNVLNLDDSKFGVVWDLELSI